MLDVRMFGQLTIRRADGEIVSLPTPKLQELFCYLVIRRNRAHPRELLFDLLWRNSPPAQARRNLRQALWQLQSTLESSVPFTCTRLVQACTASVQIEPTADLISDVAIFEQAYAPVHGLPAHKLSESHAQAIQEAVEIYQGDLLEGWYQDWCLIERDRLQNMYLAMLAKLMSFCELRRNYERGLGYGELALRYDRSNERTHRCMMRLHYLAGARAAALHQYERCAAALQEDLSVPPSERTIELYHQIRNDTLKAPAHADPSPAISPASPAPVHPLLDILGYLRQLSNTVSSLQTQLQHEIEAVERIITGLR